MEPLKKQIWSPPQLSGAQWRAAGDGCRLEGAPGQTPPPPSAAHTCNEQNFKDTCRRAEVSFNEPRPAGININNKAPVN